MYRSSKARRDLYEAFEAALEHERALFEQVGGRASASQRDPVLWQRLVEAVKATNDASLALREALKVQRDY